MQFNKLYLPITLLLIGAIWVACVDVPTGPGTNPNPDFRALARFLHAVPGGPSGNISIDGTVAGSSIGYRENTAYLDLPAGTRSLSFAGTPAVSAAFGSEVQSTVVIYPAADGSIAYLNLQEGHYMKNNGVTGFARVKFVNVASGASASIAFRRDSLKGAAIGTTTASVAFGSAPAYLQLDPGAMSVYAVSAGGYTTGNNTSINGANQVPPNSSQSTGFGIVDLSVDGGLSAVATIKSRNEEGFYTAAHIHVGPSGQNGPVLFTIPVTGQTMSFPTIQLNGQQEVPPVTTTATGTATLSVVNDSSSTAGASYSVTTVTPTAMGFFTAAHFHNAAAGTNGPVVHTINVTKQTVGFPTVTATGTATNATAAGTFTLYRDSLLYSIVARRDQFDTTFTAAHLHLTSTGAVVKDIRTTSWSDTVRTLAGTWRRTDATQPLTDALVDSLRLGRVYLMLHSVGRPAGLLRGDLIPRTTHTNTFSGRFTGGSFLTLRDEFAFKRMYFNFHTLANPGGEIRGQALPDTFSTTEYRLTRTGVPADSIGRLLNSGQLYFAFHTALLPGGQIRGQLGVDESKGQYAVTNQSLTFDNGRMYTVVAVGRGTSFQLLKLDDRQAGVTKPVIPSATETPAAKSE